MTKIPTKKKDAELGNAKAWTQFERAVDVALKTPAKHKVASPKKPKKSAAKQAPSRV